MSYEQHKKSIVSRARRKYERQEAAVEVILTHPEKSRKEQAALLGLSTAEFGKLVNDPDFEPLRQERLAQIVDPVLKETLEKKLYVTSIQAVDVVSAKLGVEPNMGDALATLRITTQALGMGSAKPQVNIQNNIGIVDVISRVKELRGRTVSPVDPALE